MFKPANLFSQLCVEVNNTYPGSRLTQKWQKQMETLTKAKRSQIVNQTVKGCSPLFIAAKRGLAEVVQYLHEECDANLEQKGLYDVPDDRSVHYVTPLWCAAVADKLSTVMMLIKLGADINSVSDTGSTPVRSACFMTNYDIVKFLVQTGANIQVANYNGGTCLINSVQNANLCKLLITNGANVNAQDIKGKTALHYAIEELRLETVQILISRGADPFIKNKLNDDALQTACIKGAYQIFEYLLKTLDISDEREAEAHELIGATYFDELTDITETIRHWKVATTLRNCRNITKSIALPNKAFNFCCEFTDENELHYSLLDHDTIKMQSLLICERILGKDHKDTIFRIMFRGASYADSLQYTRCWRLWLYVFQLRIKKDTVLYPDACNTAQALVRLLIDLFERYEPNEVKVNISFDEVFEAIKLIGDGLLECRKLLDVKPIHNKQHLNYDRMIIIIMYFLHFILKYDMTKTEGNQLARYIHSLLKQNVCSNIKKNTLLHLSVTKTSVPVSSGEGFDLNSYNMFPNYKTTEFLLECGAEINAANIEGASSLYMSALGRHYNAKIFKLLLSNGAHIDQATYGGDTALDVLKNHGRNFTDIVIPVLPLKCLAARAIVRNRIAIDKRLVPNSVQEFLTMH